MKIVFMGTPEFAVPVFERILDAGYFVAAAFTQPDRPAGRGKALCMSPVKQAALLRGVPVYQFERIRRQEGLDALRALSPDIIVTAAFGQILTQKILDIPKLGTINVHASLLPRHRGAAPIQWSIIQGDGVTGVTTMYTDAGIDTGDMILSEQTRIGPDETAAELSSRLAEIGAGLIIKTLEAVARGSAPRVKQDDLHSTYDKPLNKDDGLINFALNARDVRNFVRGVNSWPGAYAFMEDGGKLKFWSVRSHEDAPECAPGEVFIADAKKGLFIRCGEGAVEVLEMQAPGSRRMPAKAYLMGRQIKVGTVLMGKERADCEA